MTYIHSLLRNIKTSLAREEKAETPATMLIPVTSAPAGLPEWAMIEMQGKIDCKAVERGGEVVEVGTVVAAAKGSDVAHITMGYHLLEGKCTVLKKPLAIMEKQPDGGYMVVGVIRQKWVFRKRPKALISKPQARR